LNEIVYITRTLQESHAKEITLFKAETAKAIAAEKKIAAALKNIPPPPTITNQQQNNKKKLNNAQSNQFLLNSYENSVSSDDDDCRDSSSSLRGSAGRSSVSVSATAKKRKGNSDVVDCVIMQRKDAAIDALELERGLHNEMKAFLSSVVGELKSVIHPQTTAVTPTSLPSMLANKEKKKKHW